jgi:putative OPT family oligopeptide transporter
MTVSASIPAAVIALGIFKGILRKNSLLESNIVQTMASAGESLAAGIIFTVPALVIVGVWKDFEFWPTTLIAISGGLLGVVFMIPLRKALIGDTKKLKYPEGVACAAVLQSGTSDSKSGLFTILKGLGLGGVVKFLGGGMGLLMGSVEKAAVVGKSVFFAGTDVSLALLGVGYIVRLEIAMLVFIGGAIGWIIGIPLLGIPAELADASALDAAWTLWSTKIRYLGVGAMIVGGVWSIYTVRQGIASGISGLKKAYKTKVDTVAQTEKDMNLMALMGIMVGTIVLMFYVYNQFVGDFGISLFSTLAMFVLAFLFVAVSSYIVGLVGSSNNPVSGMTISALLATAILFLVLGYKGDSAILATLGVAAIVCCAACTAGDCSQDLKTGMILGATPRSQQIAQLIGVVIPAFVIAPVLTLLHSAYGIGTGLKAPQATLFASISKGIFGDGSLPYNMVMWGMVIGVVVIVIDGILQAKRSKVRLHLMPLAVGIYLPITLAVPILLGGLIRNKVDKVRGEISEGKDRGILAASGFIAGEALMGVLIAVFLYFGVNLKVVELSHGTKELLSVAVLVGVCVYLYKVSKKAMK